MKIITTPHELMERLRWDEACEMLGWDVWAVSEGMDANREIALTEDQAANLGLLPRVSIPSEPKTCAHCGRECGDMDGGSASVDGQLVCHPNKPDRPDCYRLVTVYNETLGSRL